MAHRVDVTKINGGPYPVYHVYLKSDGVSPDLKDYELITPAKDLAPRFSILGVLWSFVGMSARLYFESLVDDTLIWVLPVGSDEINFEKWGGLVDRSPVLTSSGKLLLSTQGLVGNAEGAFLIKTKAK
jgi:hypothetical protein